MTMPQFTQLPSLPPLDRRAEIWTPEEQCVFASQLYLQTYFAVAMSMLRDLGQQKTGEIYGAMLGDHQKHFFLPGMKKLGLDREKNQAAACAKYHCLSNGLGGIRTGYAVESDKKAWLFYFPYTPDNAGSSVFALATYPDLALLNYRGWHGNNGRYLGNRGLRFVSTHYISEGDPFAGGYFEDAGRDLADDELVIERRGDPLPPGLEIRGFEDDLDRDEWPALRRARALRKYAVTWFADRVSSSLHYGGDQGDAIARHAIQYSLHTWAARFHAAVGADTMKPAEELARFIGLFHTVAGIPARFEAASNGWDVTTEKGLGEFVAEPMTDGEKRRFAKVLADSWQSVGILTGCTVSSDDSGMRWQVRSRC